jgi:hypothetical protein
MWGAGATAVVLLRVAVAGRVAAAAVELLFYANVKQQQQQTCYSCAYEIFIGGAN